MHPLTRKAVVIFAFAALVLLGSCTTVSRVARTPFGALRESAPTGLENALQVNDDVKRFSLSNQDAAPWDLQTHLQQGPVVLIFYRGDWCPYCRRQLAELETYQEEFQKRNATLVAIAPDGVARYKALHDELQLSFDLLHDEDAQLIKSFGLFDEDTSTSWPAVYILENRDGISKIAWTSFAETYKNREQPRLLLQALDALQ